MASNPEVAVQHAKNFFSNYNMTKWSDGEISKRYHDGLDSLQSMIGDQAKNIDTWLPVLDNENVFDLANAFRKHGSDKATMHDYHRLYGSILSSKRNDSINILEIGLGTNNPKIPSNMSVWGKPGASMRAWRDWAPKANIYGADIDKDILFEEPRIKTFWVDQTNPASLSELAARFDIKFDLIIDDGLHEPNANINTIHALLPLLKDDGTLVVEDITLCPSFWSVTSKLFSYSHDVCLSKMKIASIFAMRNRT